MDVHCNRFNLTALSENLDPIRIHVFAELSREELAQISRESQRKLYKKSEIVFREGSIPRYLYAVLHGKIKVSQLGNDGREQIVHLIKSGDIMAHRAICAEDVFSGSAIAMEDSSVLLIPKLLFLRLIGSNAKLGLRVLQLLAEELKDAELKITQMAQSSVKTRLAHTLLELIRNYGFKSDRLTLNISITRENLAAMAGTSRESVTRILHEFQESGIIKLKGRQIQIPGEERVKKFIRESSW